MFTLFTFGDSILDCGAYNEHGVTPGGLIVANDDELFPEFRGRDLSSRGPARWVHRALDGAAVSDLPGQARGLSTPEGPAAALVTVGGNDLLRELLSNREPDALGFAAALDAFVSALPVRHVLLGTIYDPTVGDDANNLLGVDPATAREALATFNRAIAAVAAVPGGGVRRLVDLHGHFLSGDLSWFVHVIEPSLRGASEVRRAFLQEVLDTRAPETWRSNNSA